MLPTNFDIIPKYKNKIPNSKKTVHVTDKCSRVYRTNCPEALVCANRQLLRNVVHGVKC